MNDAWRDQNDPEEICRYLLEQEIQNTLELWYSNNETSTRVQHFKRQSSAVQVNQVCAQDLLHQNGFTDFSLTLTIWLKWALMYSIFLWQYMGKRTHTFRWIVNGINKPVPGRSPGALIVLIVGWITQIVIFDRKVNQIKSLIVCFKSSNLEINYYGPQERFI